MNKCPQCDSENADEILFCIRCGAKLPPSLRAFLEACGLEEHFDAIRNQGISNVIALAEAGSEPFRSSLPYGDVIRLRRAVQGVLPQQTQTDALPEADETNEQHEQPLEAPVSAPAAPPQPTSPIGADSHAELNTAAAIERVRMIYKVMLWSLPTCGAAGLIGGVMPFFQFKVVDSSSFAFNHLRYQVRTFGFSTLWGFVLLVCEAMIVPAKENLFLPLLAWAWFYYRVLKGRSLLQKGRPAYPKPIQSRMMATIILCLVAFLISGLVGAVKRGAQNTSKAAASEQQVSESEKQKADADRRTQIANQEAEQLRQTTEQARRDKEAALQRSREVELAAKVAPVQSASYGSSVLSFSEAKSRADNGDAYAQAVLSIYCGTGYKTAKDIELAAQYAMKSSAQGHPLGIYRLGVMRQSGDGMALDQAQGLELKAKALPGLDAMVDDPYAMTAIGIMLFRGENVAMDKAGAASLYKKAADVGYAPAQFTYSACLLSGQGVAKNEPLGLQYWQAAYQQSYPPALEGPPR